MACINEHVVPLHIAAEVFRLVWLQQELKNIAVNNNADNIQIVINKYPINWFQIILNNYPINWWVDLTTQGNICKARNFALSEMFETVKQNPHVAVVKPIIIGLENL